MCKHTNSQRKSIVGISEEHEGEEAVGSAPAPSVRRPNHLPAARTRSEFRGIYFKILLSYLNILVYLNVYYYLVLINVIKPLQRTVKNYSLQATATTVLEEIILVVHHLLALHPTGLSIVSLLVAMITMKAKNQPPNHIKKILMPRLTTRPTEKTILILKI